MENQNPYAYLHIPLQDSSPPFVTTAAAPSSTTTRTYHLYSMTSTPSGYMPPPTVPYTPSAPSVPLLVPASVARSTPAQAAFPYPTDESQPRRHFTGGPGVGTFADPIRGRQVTVSIYEHSALIYADVRHHHIRVTALQLADRSAYRAALFLMAQPTQLTFDVRTPAASAGTVVADAATQKDESSVFDSKKNNKDGTNEINSEAEENKGESRGGRGRGKGKGKSDTKVEGSKARSSKPESSRTKGTKPESSKAKGRKDKGKKAESSKDNKDGNEDDGDIPYSVGVPEVTQRLAVVGPPGNTVDEAIEGLERAVVERLLMTGVERIVKK